MGTGLSNWVSLCREQSRVVSITAARDCQLDSNSSAATNEATLEGKLCVLGAALMAGTHTLWELEGTVLLRNLIDTCIRR